MLKTRVIPTLLLKKFGLVKGQKFDSWRRIGAALQFIRIYNMRNVDELILLDIAATPENIAPNFAEIENLAAYCHMPLTVGGGVRSVGDVGALLKAGADKVAFNTAGVLRPNLIREAAHLFGTQCIVAAIDFTTAEGGAKVVTECGRKVNDLSVVEWATTCERLGAGEILLTSVDRDGMMTGYDLEVTKSVTERVSIPVIASGGCGSFDDMARALVEANANAVAAASIFHFTEQTPMGAKQYLRTKGIEVRL
jgi:cyclase